MELSNKEKQLVLANRLANIKEKLNNINDVLELSNCQELYAQLLILSNEVNDILSLIDSIE